MCGANANFLALSQDIFDLTACLKFCDLIIANFPNNQFTFDVILQPGPIVCVIPRRTTIFLLFSIVLFFGLLLIYTFNVITISAIIYLLLLPISFFHYQKIKKHHENDKVQDDDDLEDVL